SDGLGAGRGHLPADEALAADDRSVLAVSPDGLRHRVRLARVQNGQRADVHRPEPVARGSLRDLDPDRRAEELTGGREPRLVRRDLFPQDAPHALAPEGLNPERAGAEKKRAPLRAPRRLAGLLPGHGDGRPRGLGDAGRLARLGAAPATEAAEDSPVLRVGFAGDRLPALGSRAPARAGEVVASPP